MFDSPTSNKENAEMHERIWTFLESLGKNKSPEAPKEQGQKSTEEKSPWDVRAKNPDSSRSGISWSYPSAVG